MGRAKGNIVCAIAILLLFCVLVLGVAECKNSLSEPTAVFAVLGIPEATRPFDVNLTVQIDGSMYAGVYGDFSVRDQTESVLVYGNISWGIDFDSLTEKSYTFVGIIIPYPGSYVLWTDVHWRYTTDIDFRTTVFKEPINIQEPSAPPGESYSIEWLKPTSFDKPFHAGRTIKIGFSVFDKDGNFKRDESVNITVTDGSDTKVFTAVYGEGENPVRIKDSTECYVVYWKTEKNMSGEYTITVTFANAQVTTPPETVTIRP